MKDEIFLQLLLVSATVTPIILLLKLMGNRLRHRYAAKWKYYVWLVLAVRLLVPWSPTLPLQPLEVVIPVESITLQENEAVTWEELLTSVENASGQNVLGQNALGQGQTTSVLKQDGATEINVGGTFGWQNIFTGLQYLWLAGAIVYLGYHVVVNLYHGRNLRRWSRPAKEDLLWQIQEALGEQKFPEHLPVFVNSQVAGPMIVGLLRPKLYLPARTFEREELRFVLRHELTHFKRKDLWYKALLLVVNGVHWFNPFVHMMCREAEKDLECSCDSIVIGYEGKESRHHYANLILDEAAVRVFDRRMLTSNFYGGKGELKMRMRNILDARKKKRGTVTLGVLTAVVILGSGLWSFSIEESNAQEYQAEQPKEETSESQVPGENAGEKQQEGAEEDVTVKRIMKTDLLEQRDGLGLEGSGMEDKLLLYRVDEGGESYNVLAVLLDNGMTAIYRLPSNYTAVSDDSHIYTLPLQSDFYESIVVRLSDPDAKGTEAGTDYYILHVEVDEENKKARIVEDVAILNKQADSKNYAQHETTFIEMPFYYVMHQPYSDTAIHYHEKLEKTTLKIMGYREDTSEVATCYVYWDGEAWQTYFE